ncbi:MAG TPA: hypothetical protein VNS62_16060 [Candidatus Udaeobacter sp.]|jgi:hypothetical protein|nr:hypothetical protein [Candidatus Udaeobacter sp.]
MILDSKQPELNLDPKRESWNNHPDQSGFSRGAAACEGPARTAG